MMSAIIAVVAMLGTMISMGVAESNRNADSASEIEIVEEAPAPPKLSKENATLLRDLNNLEASMRAPVVPQKKSKRR